MEETILKNKKIMPICKDSKQIAGILALSFFLIGVKTILSSKKEKADKQKEKEKRGTMCNEAYDSGYEDGYVDAIVSMYDREQNTLSDIMEGLEDE